MKHLGLWGVSIGFGMMFGGLIGNLITHSGLAPDVAMFSMCVGFTVTVFSLFIIMPEDRGYLP